MISYHHFLIENNMEENATRMVSSAVLNIDFKTVVVNGKAYVIKPPTIHKIAGAGYYLSGFGECKTVIDMLRSLKDIDAASRALSFLIQDDEWLYDDLSQGTFDEVVEALAIGISMISVENFYKLSALAKNVALLTAKQK